MTSIHYLYLSVSYSRTAQSKFDVIFGIQKFFTKLEIKSFYFIFSLKVAGWGRTETGDPSDELRTLTTPVIDLNQCRIEMSKYKFTKYITDDKICAGYTNGKPQNNYFF